MPLPLFAQTGEAVADFTVPLLSALLGAALVLAFYFYRHTRQPTQPDDEKSRLALLFSSSNSFFYYQDLSSGKEWFSRKLKALLEIKAKNPQFDDFAQVLEERDFERLRQAIVDLKAGTPHFRLEVKTLGSLMMECYGTIRQEHGTNHLILWWQDISDRMEALEKLRRESERMKRELQLLNNTLNALPMPIWQRDEAMKIRFCNLAFMEAVDESPEDAQGEPLELYNQAKVLAQKAVTVKETAHERRFLIVQGERKLYDVFEIPSTATAHTTGVALDIHEMEAVREEMERTQAAQQDLLESTTSGMAIYGPDQRLRFYNQAFASLWKLEEAWLATEPKYSEILERLRDSRTLPEQANFPAFKQQHLKLFTDLIAPHEEFFYLPDGRTIRVLAIPHTLGGVLFAYEDVTDRLALERSYNTLIAVQKETLDNLHEGVAVFGEDGRLKLSNPVYFQMWNLTPEIAATEPHISDLLERNRPLFLFEHWEEFKESIVSQLNQRETRHQMLERRDGRVFEVIFVPLPDGQTLINYVDITSAILVERSLREKNEALQEADRVKSEFLANISYELRSPLTSISGFTEMLRHDYLGQLTSKQQEYLNSIQEASEHLTSLIDDILDIASIEAGYLQLECKSFDVAALIGALPALVEDRLHARNVTLALDCPTTIGQMEGDEYRIRQVLLNLLANAIQYSEPQGAVTLRVQAENNDALLFSVEDHGIGIREEDQEAVFGKFYRTAAASRLSSGTGLGLSMVKSFVELHGGAVSLSSRPGEGTVIRCHLPRFQPKLLASV